VSGLVVRLWDLARGWPRSLSGGELDFVGVPFFSFIFPGLLLAIFPGLLLAFWWALGSRTTLSFDSGSLRLREGIKHLASKSLSRIHHTQSTLLESSFLSFSFQRFWASQVAPILNKALHTFVSCLLGPCRPKWVPLYGLLSKRL